MYPFTAVSVILWGLLCRLLSRLSMCPIFIYVQSPRVGHLRSEPMRGLDWPSTITYIYTPTNVLLWEEQLRGHSSLFCGSPLVLHPRVIKVEYENVLRAYAHELVHYIRHFGPLHHRADCDPLRILEGRDRRCAPPGCDSGSGGEDRAADVVLAHDVFARRDYPRDARGDLFDQWR